VKERLITLATALVALAITLFLLVPPQPAEPKQSVPTSSDRGQAGLKGLAEWLRRQGVAVTSLRNRYRQLPEVAVKAAAGNVLVVSLPAPKEVQAAEWQALQDWVERGNNLLLLGAVLWRPDWSRQEACFCEVKGFLEHFGWSLQEQDEDEDEDPQPPPPDRQDFRQKMAAVQAEIQAQLPVEDQLLPLPDQPLTAGVGAVSTRTVPALMRQTWLLQSQGGDNLAVNLLLRSDGRSVGFWQISAGHGQILLSLAPDLFSNRRLGEADNARFLANLLNQSLAGDGTVIFDDYHFGLSELYDPDRFFGDSRLHRTLALLGVMWVLYVAGYSNRLAPVAPQQQRLSVADFVEVTAGFFARRIARDELARELLRHLLLDLRLARQMGDEGEAWEWLGRHPGIAAADLATLRRVRSGRRVPLLRLSETLRQVRRVTF